MARSLERPATFGPTAGAGSHWGIGTSIRRRTPTTTPPTAFTDFALQFLEEQQDDAPFLLYLAYTAPHWPLHARNEEIRKYVGKYRDVGWDRLRQRRLARQKRIGICDDSISLPRRDEGVRPWDDLTERQKGQLDYRMAVYAAMIDRMDQNIGRVVDLLKQQNKLDNTLILFLSDNGGCAEPYKDLGGGKFTDINNPKVSGAVSYGQGWANASNTPFRKFKVFSHEGGISTPLIAHWPGGITAAEGSITHTPAQLIDLMPTILEVTGASYPSEFADHEIHPLEGVSLLNLLKDKDHSPAEWMYWEHAGHAAVRNGEFKALLPRGSKRWQLYDLSKDRQESTDLAADMPEKSDQMAKKWKEWAVRVGVTQAKKPAAPKDAAARHQGPAVGKAESEAESNAERKAALRPNVLLIITDDQNDYYSQASGMEVKTPAIDRLKRQAIHFPRAYCASPVCGPSPRRAFLRPLSPPHRRLSQWRGSMEKIAEAPDGRDLAGAVSPWRLRDMGHG